MNRIFAPPSRAHRRLIAYGLLLAFALMFMPLQTAGPPVHALQSIHLAKDSEYFGIHAANPPPWQKTLPAWLPRLFWLMETELGLSQLPQTVWLGGHIPLLVKHERLDPIKYTSNYVDALPF